MNLRTEKLMEPTGRASWQVASEKVIPINMTWRRLRGLMVYTARRSLF